MAGSAQDAVKALLNSSSKTSDGSQDTAAIATLTAAGPQLLAITSTQQQSDLAAILLTRLASPPATTQQQQCRPELELLRNLSRTTNTRLTHTDALLALITHIQHTTTTSSNHHRIDHDADMAMRTLNNILMLHPSTRDTFSSSSSTNTVNGAQATAVLLRTIASTAKDQPTLIFLASRLLFFSTLFENPFVIHAVEHEALLTSFTEAVQSLTSGEKTNDAKQALTELLKLAFNISLYYPRLRPDRATKWNAEQNPSSSSSSSSSEDSSSQQPTAGEPWAHELNPLAQSTIQLFLTLVSASTLTTTRRAPLEPPIQQTVALMLNIPTSLSLAHSPTTPYIKHVESESHLLIRLYELLALALHRYFPQPPGSSSSISQKKKKKKSSTSSSSSSVSSGGSSSTTTTRATADSKVRGYGTDDLMAVALNSYFDLAERPHPSRVIADSPVDNLTYTPEDPDSVGTLSTAREQAIRDGLGGQGNLGDPELGLEPLILLARRYVVEDVGGLADGSHKKRRRTAKQSFRLRLLPDDLDRTTPPSKQPTLTGLLIRLMSSVMFPRVARASSELLLAVCGGDPQELSNAIGYGPAAGFLALMGAGVVANSSMPKAVRRTKSDGSDSGTETETSTINDNKHDGDRDSVSTPTSPNPSTGSASASRRPIDPITGRFADITTPAEEASNATLEEMTQEEREAEAERLFVLFERLNRTGVVSVGNPALDLESRARVEELSEEEERREREREEVEDEEEVMRDLEAYRRRKKGV
ncbi:hypothetical protein CF327_g4972 [Tilletia walkeri]|nr:hypothetical protein CF327_g4972 [Tilletia walkeri]